MISRTCWLCWLYVSISSSVSSAVLGFPVVGPHLQGRHLGITTLPEGSFLKASREESAAQGEEVPPASALSLSKDPASAQECRKEATEVLQEIQALVASEVQSWKRHCGSCTTLEQAGVSRAEGGIELEKEILQEYERLQTQVESCLKSIRVKTEGKLLAPHEQQIADLLGKNRELENRLKEKEEQEGILNDELAQKNDELATEIAERWDKIHSGEDVHDMLAFGASAWSKYFGDVGEEPPLPPNIVEVMESPCPFWTEKKIRETHLLVLIPSTVDGQSFSLDLLATLTPKAGVNHTSSIWDSTGAVTTKIGTKTVERSYWMLITQEILPNSTKKTYDEQKALIASHGQESAGMDYRHPSALEAATAELTNYVRTGVRLVGMNVWTRTCEETIDISKKRSKRPMVGYFFAFDILLVFLSCCKDVEKHRSFGALACCAWKQDPERKASDH